MLPATREIVRAIAKQYSTDEKEIVSQEDRRRELRPARIAVARVLHQHGYTITRIAGILKRDRHTVNRWLE